jgi:NAD(P)H-dependent flavin oxidoreductase YrpB (nitropropane dioxygenase family)
MSLTEARIVTPLTRALGIKHPILLAGMGVVSNAELVAAVSNAGGMGVLGGVNYSPELLRKSIEEIKAKLNDPNAPFGVDLLLPQVGGSARKTNKDYTVRSANRLSRERLTRIALCSARNPSPAY